MLCFRCKKRVNKSDKKARKELLRVIDIQIRANKRAGQYLFWKTYFSEENPEITISYQLARKIYGEEI